MKRMWLFGATLFGLVSSAFAAQNYPYTNPYEATIFGTPTIYQAALPTEIKREELAVKLYAERKTPDVFWYNDQFKYSVVYQDKPAPLVFSIAGTGATYSSSKMKILERAFYQAGYNVISITSPTHPAFIVAASTDQMPGYLEQDAKELYRVMDKLLTDAKQKLGNKLQVTDYLLTGYSLGGSQAAFVSKLDEKEKHFNFKKVLIVNPSVSLYNSVEILDNYVNKLGVASVGDTINRIFSRVEAQISNESHIELTPEYIYDLMMRSGVNHAEMSEIIGIAFRLSSVDMIYAIDVMHNIGAVTYKNHQVSKFESNSEALLRGEHIGFLDYFNNGMLPFFQQQQPGLTRDTLLARLSLTEIADYLRSSKKIGMVTNADDIILTPADLTFLRDTFGERGHIYPHGGHCGNMNEKNWIDNMLAFFNSNSVAGSVRL